MMLAPRIALVLLALFALMPNRDAAAQLGGLKRKLKEAVKGPEQAKPADAANLRFSGDLLELTEPVLENFMRGLQTELALQQEFKALLATYPTPEQFRACELQVAQSEEAQKILEGMNVPDNATAAEAQRIMAKLTTDLDSLRKRKCPLDPHEWDPTRKAERLKEIELKAAEAVGPASPAPGDWGLDGDGIVDGPAAAASIALAARISVGAYSLIKERIVAYCASPLAAQDPDPSAKDVRIPGTGSGIYYFYTVAEAKALKARCKQLMALLGQVM